MRFEELKSRTPHFLFLGCGLVTVFVVVFLFSFILYMAYPVFKSQGIYFLLGSEWSYNRHIYGIRTFLMGTLIITAVTLIMAVPVGVFTAIYLAEFASERVVSFMRPLVELLVGIPSVVYGIFGFSVLSKLYGNHLYPFVSSHLGFISIFYDPGGYSGLGVFLASSVLSVMILPTIIAVSEDSIRAVPYEFKEASFAVGATHWETIKCVVVPAAWSGILTSVVLGTMRAMGETMAISMLIGCCIKVPGSIFDVGYAMTSKILNDAGEHMATPESRSALFAMSAVLFSMEILLVGLARKLGGRR